MNNSQNRASRSSVIRDACVKNVLTGIDTLELNVVVLEWGLNEHDWVMIEDYKKLAQSTPFENDDSNIDLAGTNFKVKRSGKPMYEYILVNADMKLEMHKEIKDAAFYPILRLVLSSEFLWSHGYFQVKEIVEGFLIKICAYEKIIVSRCDLTADFEGACPQINLDQFVTAARSKDLIMSVHNKGHYLTGYTVGGRAIHLDIYDKTYEIKHKSHKEWFYDPWRLNEWDGESPVTRYEYRIRR